MAESVRPDQNAKKPEATLRVGLAGLGFMGATHWKAWQRVEQAQIVAVMDLSQEKLAGDLSSVGGNFGGPGQKLDFSKLRTYRSFEELIQDREIDAVDICLPTDQHGRAATAALRAGKHVLVEKPMAIDERETNALLEEADKSGRTLMVGQILRFMPAYMELANSLRSAGAIRSAVFRRRCAAPTWSAWLTDSAKSGGGIFDLLIHDVDYCISQWGVPRSVRAVGYEELTRGIDVVQAQLEYPQAGPVVVTGGWFHPGNFPFSMDFSVVTDKNTWEWTSNTNVFNGYGKEGDATSVELPESDPFLGEVGYFADCAAHGRAPRRCLPEESAQAVAVMHRIVESRQRKGEPVSCKG
jgi:predicted dehydrogenase